jgi:hypothetical protein
MQIVKTVRVTCIRTEMANRVELSDGLPRHDLVKVIKRHAEQVFKLLAWPERTPLRMGEAGSRMSEPRELDELAGDRIGDTGLALSFERRACHLPAHVARNGWRRKNLLGRDRGTVPGRARP